jgi:hypothetical protein
MVMVLSEQLAVLGQEPLGDFGQGLLKLLPGSFVANGLQGARDSLGPEDPFDGSGLKGLIPDGMFDGPVDILTLVVLFHPQDGSGVKPTVSGMSLGQSLEKLLRRFSQLQKGLPDWLQTIALFWGFEVIRIFYLFPQPCRISLMPGDKLNLGAIDQDLVLRCLEAQDVGDVGGGDGVVVGLKLNEPV